MGDNEEPSPSIKTELIEADHVTVNSVNDPEERRVLWALLIGVALFVLVSCGGAIASIVAYGHLRNCLVESNDSTVARVAFTTQLDELTRQQNAIIIQSAEGKITRERAISEYKRIQTERENVQKTRDQFKPRSVRDCI